MISKKYISIFLMLISAACLSIGQMIWKLMPDYNIFYITGGFVVYFFGALALILAYRNGELSALQPLNSMSYVFASFISIFILKEVLSFVNIIGIILIVIGVIIMGFFNKC